MYIGLEQSTPILLFYLFVVIILNSITYVYVHMCECILGQKNKKKNIKPTKLKAHIQRYTAFCT